MKVEYDVALSFADEDRKYAEHLAHLLAAQGIKVFYDRWEQDKLWGENLYDYLQDIYKERAHYCVMFLSKHYRKKLWTKHERVAAQARAFRERKAYILPVRLDETEIPGIPETVCYLDLASVSIEDVARLVLHKLGQDQQLTISDPVEFFRSAIRQVLQLDEDNLFFHRGRYDSERWVLQRELLRATKTTIASFGEAIIDELKSTIVTTDNVFLLRNLLEIVRDGKSIAYRISLQSCRASRCKGSELGDVGS